MKVKVTFPFPALAACAAVIALAGCGRGYVVNKTRNEVIWETWGEADAATFKRLNLGQLNGFVRDRRRMYFQGREP